jgi:alpha-glutamyl/putrescinyl thymine pyrophosphorylase clade 1
MNLPTGVIPSSIHDDFWRFISERHNVFLKRQAGLPKPWTNHPVISTYKLTNVFRAVDSVSQKLLRDVIYSPGWETRGVEETIFRTFLFKMFNKNSTWDLWVNELGEEPSLANFTFERYDRILTEAQDRGDTIWSNAFMVTAHGSFGDRRHRMYLRLLAQWMDEKVPERITKGSMQECFDILMTYRTVKDFLANQYTLDTGYSPFVDWDENDFVAAGPGTIRGFNKAFTGIKKGQYADIARYLVETQDEHFDRLGLAPARLGNRKLHLNDMTNCGCEFDKACRVMHPDFGVPAGAAPTRTRIKQKFTPSTQPPPPLVFPPKWEITS